MLTVVLAVVAAVIAAMVHFRIAVLAALAADSDPEIHFAAALQIHSGTAVVAVAERQAQAHSSAVGTAAVQ